MKNTEKQSRSLKETKTQKIEKSRAADLSSEKGNLQPASGDMPEKTFTLKHIILLMAVILLSWFAYECVKNWQIMKAGFEAGFGN